MRRRDLPVLLSIILSLLVIPLTLAAVKVNQDNRSQAMIKQSPLPTIRPIQFSTPSPTPSAKL